MLSKTQETNILTGWVQIYKKYFDNNLPTHSSMTQCCQPPETFEDLDGFIFFLTTAMTNLSDILPKLTQEEILEKYEQGIKDWNDIEDKLLNLKLNRAEKVDNYNLLISIHHELNKLIELLTPYVFIQLIKVMLVGIEQDKADVSQRLNNDYLWHLTRYSNITNLVCQYADKDLPARVKEFFSLPIQTESK